MAKSNKRMRAEQVADAINSLSGVQVSDKAKELSALWVSGSVTSAEMKKQLIDYHRKTEH